MNISTIYSITLATNNPLLRIGVKFILFFCFSASFGQITTSNNEQILFRKNLDLNNASLVDTSSYLNVGSQSFFSDLAGIRSFYVSGNLSLKHKKQSYSFIGFNVINGQFGPLINDIQARLRYSHRLKITPTIEATAGIELGFVNVSFTGTSTTSGGSDLAPDFNAMFALFNKQWKIGASLNHVTNPAVQPLFEQFRYQRNLNIHGEYIFNLSPHISLVPAYQSIFFMSNYLYKSSLSIICYDLLELGFGVRNEGVTVNCGIKKLKLKPFDLTFHAGYRAPILGKSVINSNLFQIHLGAIFKK